MYFLLLFFFVTISFAHFDSRDCMYTASDGISTYDLHLFRAHHMNNLNKRFDRQGLLYHWNLCEPILEALFHSDMKKPCPPHAFVCQESRTGIIRDVGGRPREISDGEDGPTSGLELG
jgi:hypothetical protein